MKLELLDTGYVSNETRGGQTQLSDANRAGYTGSAVTSFTLNTKNLTMTGDVKIENKPLLNVLTDTATSLISTTNRIVKVDIHLDKTIITSGYSTNMLYQLMRMERTKGLKLLYPSLTTDTRKNIIEAMGGINIGGNFSDGSPTDDNGTVSSTTPYLLGRVKKLNLKDKPSSSKWTISFDFEISE